MALSLGIWPMNVGTDHDTAAFAVESIRGWWHSMGRETYPEATCLLITAGNHAPKNLLNLPTRLSSQFSMRFSSKLR